MFITAEKLEVIKNISNLNNKTVRFLDNVGEGNFWDWASTYYFTDIVDIVNDMARFLTLNEVQKIFQSLGEFEDILNKYEIKNNVQIKTYLNELKNDFDYSQVMTLKVRIKLLLGLLSL